MIVKNISPALVRAGERLNPYARSRIPAQRPFQREPPHVFRQNLGSYGGAWEDWCEDKYRGDPLLIAACRSKPSIACPAGICLPAFAPWTDLGAAARGLPKNYISATIQSVIKKPAVDAQQPGPIPGGDPAVLQAAGSVSTSVLVGGALFLAAGIAFALRK